MQRKLFALEPCIEIIFSSYIKYLRNCLSHLLTDCRTIFGTGNCRIKLGVINIKIMNDTKMCTGNKCNRSSFRSENIFFRKGFLRKESLNIKIKKVTGITSHNNEDWILPRIGIV